MTMKHTKKMILLANFLAIAIVLSLIESMINIFPIPGIKIGFANVVTLIVLYIYSFKDGLAMTLLRVILVSVLSGRLFGPTFYMGFTGALFSFLVMGFLKKLNYFSILGVSVIGAISHIIGQMTAGIFVIGSTIILYWMPVMLLVSIPAGIVTGLIAKRFLTLWSTWHNEIDI